MKANGLKLAAQCFVAVVGLVLAGCKSVPDGGMDGVGARVVSVQGRARCSSASDSWRKLSTGDPITTGNVIQTALTSTTDIAVPVAEGTDADRILLPADSVVFIEGLPRASATGDGNGGARLKLQLRQGELNFTAPQTGQGSPCEIRFAKGVISAHGATFNLRADGELKVFRGVVALTLSGDKLPRNIEAGSHYDPLTGGLTTIPAGREVRPPAAAPATRTTLPQWGPWPTRKY